MRANWRPVVAAVLCILQPLCCGTGATASPAKQAPPKVMLWSWFAEDDFRPLTDPAVGVAYLALSLRFEGRGVTPSPRAMAVRISPDAYKMAVVRFDYPSDRKPSFSPRQAELAAAMVAEIAEFAKPQAVQIDFDAPQSAWPFYRQLLTDIRSRLGPGVFLSVTALVSWCDSAQSWLNGLPVDEIVPMAFSMGQATPAIVTMLQKGIQFPFSGCRGSIGVELPADHDVLVRPRKVQRAYFFPGGQKWSPQLVSRAKQAILP